MRLRLAMHLLPVALFGLFFPQIFRAQQQEAKAYFGLDEVIKLIKADVPEDVIVTKIKKNAKPFDLSVDEVLELRQKGVSDTIIKYLMDPSMPYAPPPPPAVPLPAIPAPPPPQAAVPPSPATPAPKKEYPHDAFAEKVPSDPGLYLLVGGELQRITVKALVGSKITGKIVSLLPGGNLLKGKASGHLPGAKATVRSTKVPVQFYLRLTSSGKIEEVALVALKVKNNRRELTLSAEGGQKQNPRLKVEAMRLFDSLEVGPKLHRITALGLTKGEYLLYLMGSADQSNGIQGKGYDFGVQ